MYNTECAQMFFSPSRCRLPKILSLGGWLFFFGWMLFFTHQCLFKSKFVSHFDGFSTLECRQTEPAKVEVLPIRS
jgi:hypothetical protein